jgi:hypothetical protein
MASLDEWKGVVSFVSQQCPTLAFGDRSKIASDLWELQKAERETLRAQRDAEVEQLRAMRLAEQRALREMQAAEQQYARIERAVLRAGFMLAAIVGLALFLALWIQATWDSRQCELQLAATQTEAERRAASFAEGLAEMQRLAQRLARP